MSQRKTTGDPSKMSERLGEWLTLPCSHQLEQVAEHASSVVRKVISPGSAQLVAAVAEEAAELASNVERKVISQENAQLVVAEVEEATEPASNVEKKATCQESAPLLALVEVEEAPRPEVP